MSTKTISIDEKFQTLRSICLFQGFPDDDLQSIADQASIETFEKGRFLFFEGDPLNKIFFVKEGSVRLIRQTLDGDESAFQLVLSGGVIAAVESLTADTYPFSAEVTEPAVLLAFSKKNFQEAVSQSKVIYQNCLRCANQKFRDLSSAHRDLMREQTAFRLAKILLDLSQDTAGGTLPASRILADLIGSTPETVLRLLSRFRKDGILEQNGKLPDRMKLLNRWPFLEPVQSCIICTAKSTIHH